MGQAQPDHRLATTLLNVILNDEPTKIDARLDAHLSALIAGLRQAERIEASDITTAHYVVEWARSVTSDLRSARQALLAYTEQRPPTPLLIPEVP